jgi:hypothetical protein
VKEESEEGKGRGRGRDKKERNNCCQFLSLHFRFDQKI